MDDEYYDIARKVRDAAKKFERGINALWAICFGFTFIYLIIGAYYNAIQMIVMGAVTLSGLIVTRAIIEVAEDLREEIRRMAELCRRGESE
jgi:hypothetical protein